MGDRGDKRVGGLSGQHGAAQFDRSRDHGRDRPADLPAQAVDGQQRGLHAAGVVAGLHQQHVRSALDQAGGLLVVRLDQLRKRDPADYRDGLGGGPHRAGDKARPRGRRKLRGRLPRQPRRRHVQFVRTILLPVFAHGNPAAVERVGLDHVGPGFQIRPVDSQHDVRPVNQQHLVAAFQGRPAEIRRREVLLLQHGPHGPVEHKDTSVQDVGERLLTLLGRSHKRLALFILKEN